MMFFIEKSDRLDIRKSTGYFNEELGRWTDTPQPGAKRDVLNMLPPPSKV
jgi:hypothetical protein